MITEAELVKEAKALMRTVADHFEASPLSWTQGAMARRIVPAHVQAARGLPERVEYCGCDLYAPEACQHCVVGKLYTATASTPFPHAYGYKVSDAAFLLLDKTIATKFPAFAASQPTERPRVGYRHRVIAFNDAKERTVAEVIAVLRKAAL